MRSIFEKNRRLSKARTLLSSCVFVCATSLEAHADCDIPTDATVRTIAQPNHKMLTKPRADSSPVASFELKKGHQLSVWGELENGYLKACFQGKNSKGFYRYEGYVRDDWFQVKDAPAARASGGRGTVVNAPQAATPSTNGCIPPGLDEEPLIGSPIVKIKNELKLQNFAGFDCPELYPFRAQTKFYQLPGRKLDKDGNALVEVAVHSKTRGAMVSGWVKEADVEITYDGNTEAGYCAHGGCKNQYGNNAQDLADVARFYTSIGADESGEGCKILDQGNPWSHENAAALRACVDTLRERIWRGTGGSRKALMCSMRTRLSPKEQELAAMIFTALGEGGDFIRSPSTGEPRYKELSFVQQVIENRTRQLKRDKGNLALGLTAMDVALAYKQFSVYRKDSFHGVSVYLNPNNDGPSINSQFDGAVRALIDMKNGAVGPDGLASKVDMYYSPEAMGKGTNLPGRHASLVRRGYLDHTHPETHKIPPWNFSKLTPFWNINFRGIKKDHSWPNIHNFYISKSQRAYGKWSRILKAKNDANEVMMGRSPTCSVIW